MKLGYLLHYHKKTLYKRYSPSATSVTYPHSGLVNVGLMLGSTFQNA